MRLAGKSITVKLFLNAIAHICFLDMLHFLQFAPLSLSLSFISLTNHSHTQNFVEVLVQSFETRLHTLEGVDYALDSSL